MRLKDYSRLTTDDWVMCWYHQPWYGQVVYNQFNHFIVMPRLDKSLNPIRKPRCLDYDPYWFRKINIPFYCKPLCMSTNIINKDVCLECFRELFDSRKIKEK